MSAGKLDISIDQGSTFRLQLQAIGEDLLPVDLTQWAARAKILLSDAAGTRIDLTHYCSIPSPATDGYVRVDVPADVTEAWSFYLGEFDLEIYNSTSGEVIRLVKGLAALSHEVTTP